MKQGAKDLAKQMLKKKLIAAIPTVAPFVLGALGFVILILAVVSPIAAAKEAADTAADNVGTFFERFGGFLTGKGWNTDEEAYFKLLNDEKLGCKNAKIVTATLMYYYQNASGQIEIGEDPDVDQNITTNEDGEYFKSDGNTLDYGKLYPDAKRLIKKIKKDMSTYEKYVKNTFLEQSPYNKLLENSDDREQKKQKIYDEIISISEAIECPNKSLSLAGGYCTYTTSKGIVASDIKVRLLNCGNISDIAASPMQNENLIDLETYITGVVYQEVGSSNDEVIKAQAVLARSFLLSRNSAMGGIYGAVEQIDGQWVVSIRACTGDQAFCHPDRGCWSHTCGGEYNWGKNAGVDATIYPGFSGTESRTCNAGQASNDWKWGKPPLEADSKIRKLVQETAGEYAVDESGKTAKIDFMDTEQNNWESMAKSGMNYKDIIKKTYPNVDNIVSDCVAPAGGQIRLPLSEGSYTVTSTFGKRDAPTDGASSNHSGIDLAAPTGTPIYAIAPGTVIYSQIMSGYGNVVVLGHDIDSDGTNDYITVYGHQSELMVTAGERVSGGQQIGKVGSTGVSTGPHLHFEIRTGSDFNSSVPQDPEPYLNDIKAGTSIFNEMIQTKEKYYNQGDYSDVAYCPGMNTTIQTSGCLPTSFAMIVAYLSNSSITPTDIANDICSNYSSYRVEGGGTNQDILTDQSFLSKYNIRSTKITTDYETNIKNALSMHKPIIVNVSGGTFNPSGTGHFFVLIDLGSNGKVKVLDPGSRERTNIGEYDISTVTSNISSGIWIFE